jgi:hypothetical protein
VSALPSSTAADWPRVLAHVEQALAEALAKIQQRESALALAAANAPAAVTLDFQRFQEPQVALEGYPKRAQEHLVALDGTLREGEEALRQWLVQAEAVRRQLGQTAAGRNNKETACNDRLG